MDSTSRLLAQELVRGERVAWIFRWVLYSLVLALAATVYFVQGHQVGLYGMALGLVPLAYNFFLTPWIRRGHSPPWMRYLSTTLDLAGLTAYNVLDTVLTSPLIPVTSATLVIYPVLIFLSALRLDRGLIAYTTLVAVAAMDALYIWAFPRFDPAFLAATESIDPMSQVYRSFYVLLCGGLMMFIPSTIRRLLRAQEEAFEVSRYHSELAHRDALTGLANRLALDERLPRVLGRAQREGRQVGLLFLDLNKFKPVNDTWGHDAGDLVLAEVGRRLNATVREGDFAARFGGDEFVVVLSPVEGPETCQALARRIEESLAKPFALGTAWAEVGVSFGWSVAPADGWDPGGLLTLADQRMLGAKQSQPR